MKKLTLLLCLALVACGDDIVTKTVTDCSKNGKEVAQFVVDCAKAANPLSDEEGEDLVVQCEQTGKKLLCTQEEIVMHRSNGTCYTKDNVATNCFY
jgi:hypothetical protein